MFQQTIIIGRVGRDAEMRYTQDGTPVTSFSVATSRKWTTQAGEQKENTTWFRVSAWGKQAEVCNKYVKKGMLVMVEGELSEPKPYQDKNSTWRASLDVRANRVQFLSSKGEGSGDNAAPAALDEIAEEDIPF